MWQKTVVKYQQMAFNMQQLSLQPQRVRPFLQRMGNNRNGIVFFLDNTNGYEPGVYNVNLNYLHERQSKARNCTKDKHLKQIENRGCTKNQNRSYPRESEVQAKCFSVCMFVCLTCCWGRPALWSPRHRLHYRSVTTPPRHPTAVTKFEFKVVVWSM